MDTTQLNHASDAIQQAYEQFNGILRRQSQQLESLDETLKLLRTEQRQLEEAASYLLGPLENCLSSDKAGNALSPSAMLASALRLAAATHIGQIFEVLARESTQMSGRAAVFEVRGRAAWGAAAGGFEPEFIANSLRHLVVPLSQEGPFREVVGSAEAVETGPADLEQEGHLLAELSPSSDARILLIPIRSADSVVAILYAETGGRRDSALIDALKVMAEFAGRQIDRIMITSGGLVAVGPEPAKDRMGRGSEQAEGDEVKAPEPQPSASLGAPDAATSVSEPAEISAPSPEAEQPSAASGEVTQSDEAHPAESAGHPHPTEDEEKIHRDAQRFSRLLVSEIELYNKSSVEEGRRNKDLYQRLKKDIDRSRETYEKRFAHTAAKQFDYFYDELVRTLAENDPTLLGSGYPGPSA